MKIFTLLRYLTRLQRRTGADAIGEPATHPLARLATLLRRRLKSWVAFAATPRVLSLDSAAKILETMRHQQHNPQQIALQRKAFARLHGFVLKQPVAQQADTLQPLLILLASCLARLPDLQQRAQALRLIEMSLQHKPQLALAEALTTQLWGLSRSLKPRVFDAIDHFLQHSGTDPRHQIDILLELADVMQIPSCRQRAGGLVEAGLRRLDAAPELRERIQSRLTLPDIRLAAGRPLRFGL